MDELSKIAYALDQAHRNSEDVHWLYSPDYHRPLYLSPGFEKTMGYNREPMLKHPNVLNDYFVPDSKNSVHPFLVFTKKIMLGEIAPLYKATYQIIRKDGAKRWMLDCGHCIFNQTSKCIAIAGYAIDITEIKLSQELSSLCSAPFPNIYKKRYYLRHRYSNLYLTHREAECAFYILQGKSAKEMGKILRLSPRSVENYIMQIKGKLGIQFRSQLVERLLESGFLDIIA